MRSAELGIRRGCIVASLFSVNPSAKRTPSVKPSVCQLPLRGSLLVQCKHGVQCRTPSRSDRFNGITGVARGPKGRNRNLPWPPGKKDYKVAYSSLFNSLSLAYGSTAPSTGRLLGAFYQLFLVIPHCRADMQANYCLHLIFMIYLKAKLPQGVRHAKAAYC